MAVRIKVCCISSVSEARLAVQHGASALGLVAEMPSGPGVIDERLIGEIAAQVPPAVSTFLLTSHRSADAIVAQHRRCRTSVIQLCDALPAEELTQLRQALGAVRLVQVIHVSGSASIDDALAVAPSVDAILLDSGNPTGAVKTLGGTGRVHDWQISAKLVEAVSKPVFLAGGLNADNVAEAIRRVRPFGVDICNGVRRNDTLDDDQLARFVAACHG